MCPVLFISSFSYNTSDVRLRILYYAMKWNATQENCGCKRNLLDAWRQVTEVLLCTVPNDLLPADTRQQLLLDLLQSLLNKVLTDGTIPELSNQVSGVVLLLLASLRHTYAGSSGSAPTESSQYVAALDRSSAGDGPLTAYSTSLHVILKGLVMWITNTSEFNL